MSNDRILAEMLKDSTPFAAENDFKRICLPFLSRTEDLDGSEKVTDAVRGYLIKEKCAKKSLNLLKCPELKELFGEKAFSNLCKEVFYSNGELEIEADVLNGFKAFFSKLRILSEEIKALEILELLTRCKVLVSLKELQKGRNDRASAFSILKKFLAKSESLSELINIRGAFGGLVSREDCLELYCEGLLLSGDKGKIDTVSEVLKSASDEPISALAKEVSQLGLKTLAAKVQERLVTEAAQHYLDSSDNLKDPNLDLARLCLEQCQEGLDEVRRTKRLLEAVDIVKRLNMKIVPKNIRQLSNRDSVLSYSERILEKNPRLTLEVKDDVMNLGSCLATAFDLDWEPLRGRLLGKLASRAQHPLSEAICDEIMDTSCAVGWRSCYELSSSGDVSAEKRQKLLSFCATYGDQGAVASVMKATTNVKQAKSKTPKKGVGFFHQFYREEKLQDIQKNYSFNAFSNARSFHEVPNDFDEENIKSLAKCDVMIAIVLLASMTDNQLDASNISLDDLVCVRFSVRFLYALIQATMF